MKTLAAANDAFHEAYDDAREAAKVEAPVFLLMGDALVLRRGDERYERVFMPPSFHVIKAVAHVPVALYALLSGTTVEEIAGPKLRRVEAFREKIAAYTPGEALSHEAAREVEGIMAATSHFLTKLVTMRRVHTEEVEGFAASTGQALLRLTHHATAIALDALECCVEEMLALLDDEARKALQVVVAGDHQARARSLGMQYFQARLPAVGGVDQVTYAEGVDDEEAALAIVGTRRLDAAIATSFFGDPKRLQRDVLGDAARDLLAKRALPIIG